MQKNKILNFIKILPFLFISFTFLNCKKRLVIVPISDIVNKTTSKKQKLTYPIFSKNNPEELSQVLYGELLEEAIPAKENDEWLNVKCLEQEVYLADWRPLQGYIKKNHTITIQSYPKYNLVTKKQWSNVYKSPDSNSMCIMQLSIGTKLYGEKIINNQWYTILLPTNQIGYISLNDVNFVSEEITIKQVDDLRFNLIETAIQFIDNPYRWGGRSAYKKDYKKIYTGTDCSGFINLVYRANGIELPKNSKSQFNKSNPVLKGKKLKSGDLIFLSPIPIQTFNKINHVMMYLGDNLIIECTGLKPFCKTIIIESKKRLGKKIEDIKAGDKYKKNYIYFGSYLNDEKKIKECIKKFFYPQ
ncbi:hypothetical protein GF322_03675 [Candidatus Dependentiae bacterium]|nr:hypothetical protein [Candidatus Dependentiae bacterium]